MGLFSKLPRFFNPEKNSLHFLNLAQFMGALNDNIFKFVIAFLLIDIKGPDHASSIMWKAGLIFVVPFLLFSSTAGVLADRFSKQKLLQTIKAIEIATMVLAMIAFGLKSIWASYSLLFLLSTHSAMFGPSKYAIISELVPKELVASANGLITSFTYLAIIVGTFLASFLTKISHHNFVIVAGFCLLVAIIGFISTYGIKPTPPQGSHKRLNLLFVREIIHTLRFCKTRKHLLVAVFSSAYFLFIGSFVQLNIIPYTIHALHLRDVVGGYLFLSTALGIAFGSYIGGKLSKRRIELGLSCFAGLFIALFLMLLWPFAGNLITVIFFLLLLGIVGGLFIVPFDSFVQLYSPSEKRGQIIAANNFLSFCGVFVASLMLYLYSEILNLSPEAGFFVTGALTLVIALGMCIRLSDLSLPFLARALLYPFSQVDAEGIEVVEKEGTVFILRQATWKKALLLLTVAPNLHLIVEKKSKRRFPWVNRLFYSIHLVPRDKMKEYVEKLLHRRLTPCLFEEGEELTIPGISIDVHLADRHNRVVFSKIN
jgi:acyl-[acyl-carrier-protein]-phospholipid O-acyltransferase/long-chain-fatty-acid--[acyl-carrier-protein] ligase